MESQDESLIIRLVKWWLAFLVLTLPLQSRIAETIAMFSRDHARFTGYLDELTILILLPPALFKIYVNKEYPIRLYNALLLPIVLLVIAGFISGFLNENAFRITAMGIFSYVEGFLVIFIYAAFFQRYDEVRDLFNILIKLAIVLVVVALFQEAWALKSKYILGMENYDIGKWRLGIYRPASLMKSPNTFGLYILLIFTIYLGVTKKMNYFIASIFLSGIILSLSRVVYTGLIFLCIAQIYRKKKPFTYVLVSILVLLLMIAFVKNVDFNKRVYSKPQVDVEVSTYTEYRTKTRQTAISIWLDNIYLGTGPGMYGGMVSLKNGSRVYKQYGYSEKVMWHLARTGHIDQFWFQLLAEMGIVGVIIFCMLFVNLIAVLLILRIWASSSSKGNLFVGLLIITMTMIMFSTFTGLTSTSLVFTFSASIGLAIGSENEHYG